jgi:hypothetical protein
MEPGKVKDIQAEIAAIRELIAGGKHRSAVADLTDTSLSLNIVVLAAVLAISVIELITGTIHASLQVAEISSAFQWLGITEIGSVLLIATAGLYLLILVGAKRSHLSLTAYLERHFPRLQLLSLCSDLLIKFLIFCVLLLAKGAPYVPVILLLFTADYLIQRRLFVLPNLVGIVLATLALGLALLMLRFNSMQVLFSLSYFAVVSTMSTGWILWERRKLKQES